MNSLTSLGIKAKAASKSLNIASSELKNKALTSIAKALKENFSEIVEANQKDIALAKEKVQELFQFDEIIETVAGSVVTSHCGRNTLGVLFIYDK